MHDHQGAYAALTAIILLLAWYARTERRLRRQAEDERDLYEDEIVRTHEGDRDLARLREERERATAGQAYVDLRPPRVVSPLVEVPHQTGPVL